MLANSIRNLYVSLLDKNSMLETESVLPQHGLELNRYLVSITTAILIWSASFVATKTALRSFLPLGLGLIRFGLAAVLLGFVLIMRKDLKKPGSADLAKLVLSGFWGITVYFALENIGVKYSTASDASLIVSSYPAITMLLETIFFREKFPVVSYIGVALAIVGVYIIVSMGYATETTDRLFGDILLIKIFFFVSYSNHAVKGK